MVADIHTLRLVLGIPISNPSFKIKKKLIIVIDFLIARIALPFYLLTMFGVNKSFICESTPIFALC